MFQHPAVITFLYYRYHFIYEALGITMPWVPKGENKLTIHCIVIGT